MKPIISVIMPVYNGQKYVGEAIESILSQTYKNFEFIIIDDGSNDGTTDILKHYHKNDKRIIILQNQENKGVAYSRNKGIATAQGKYIAVMDSDDISVDTRFDLEIDFLETHPEIGAVGSNYRKITMNGDLTDFQTSYSLSPGINRWRLFFANQHCHPATMIRRDLFERFRVKYDENIQYAVDYDLWFQINEVSKIANIPNILHYLRSHKNSLTKSNPQKVQASDAAIIMNYVRKHTNLNFPDRLGIGMKYSKKIAKLEDARQISQIILKLYQQTKRWDISNNDQKYIRRSVSAKLRAIWHSQNNHPALLLYVLYSFILFPEALIKKFSGNDNS